MKIYPKIKAPHNLYKDEILVEGDKIWIEEKIDGSNFSFYKDKDNKLRFYSRNQEVFSDDDSPFNKLVKELEVYFEHDYYFAFILKNHIYVCEYIKMGKIKYKDNYVSEIDRLIGIDVLKVDDIESWISSDEHRKIERLPNSFSWFEKIELRGCPRVSIGTDVKIPIKVFMENINKIANVNSFYNPNTKAEGIVIKTTTKTVKVVNPEFQEIQKNPKKVQGTSGYNKFMVAPRIRKYITRLIEDGKLRSDWDNTDYSVIFKNIDLFVNDVWEEEQEEIKKILFKEMKSQSAKEISKALTDGIITSNYEANDYSYADFLKENK